MKKKSKNSEAERVRRWFAREVTCDGEAFVIDAEQAAAVASEAKNAIVVARAGSGKTRTIVAKIVYLIAKCGVKPEEIVAFVFNANAAAEINARLARMRVGGEPILGGAVGNGGVAGNAANGGASKAGRPAKIASTFHAFARKAVYASHGKECGVILVDDVKCYVYKIVSKMLYVPEWAKKIRQFVLSDVRVSDRGQKMTDEELSRFVARMTQFVNRAQQRFLAGENTLKESVEKRLAEEIDQKERLFLELGMECYRRYHYYLLEKDKEKKESRLGKKYAWYGTDFNLIVSWASKLIDRGDPKAIKMVEDKKYILVDEYQDFSQLFLSVVLAMRRVVPDAHLFVVGDDWQAINRFAGSDVEYFREFEKYFPEDSQRYEITTNYRCDFEIVDVARKFMKKAMHENGNFWAKSQRAGKVALVNSQECTVADVIRHEKKAEGIMILHRNNEPIDKLRPELRKQLKSVMTQREFNKKVQTLTMHRSKGLESEVVIILEADEGVIPRESPDANLYAVFGETEEEALDDQKRLFYVAMTRAKRRLYIMHSGTRRDGFIKYLGRGIEKWEK